MTGGGRGEGSGSGSGSAPDYTEDYEYSFRGGDNLEGSFKSQAKRFAKDLIFGGSTRGRARGGDSSPAGGEDSFRRGGGGGGSGYGGNQHSNARVQRSQGTMARLSNGPSGRLRLGSYIISPLNRYLLGWAQFVLVCAAYSAVITPFEFGFFRRLPQRLLWIDIGINVVFFADMVLTFFTAFTDKKTHVLIDDHRVIALRYLRTSFPIELLALVPWDSLYKAAGHHGAAEVLRWMIWTRTFRAHKVEHFLIKLERDIRLSYFAIRIVKLLTVELYATHIAGCCFYYLATTVPSASEDDTWIGSLTLGGNSYANFRDLDLGKRYVTSLYWSVVTMATLGYGDIHPVNPREMIFCMIFVSFDMILGAYLLGNITALVVKGSSTERYRDKMASLIKYMNRNHLPRGLRDQMRHHLRLQFETQQVDDRVLEDFPISIRHKVSRALFRSTLEDCYLFAGCSHEFVNQIVARSSAEHYMPQEIVMQQRDAADNMYVVVSGALEELEVGRDGTEDLVTVLYQHNVVGEVAVMCNIPQPFTVRVREVCQLLRVDKQAFNNVLSTYVLDGRQLVANLLQKTKAGETKVAALAFEISNLIAQQEAELIMTTINAAARGDVEHIKTLMKAGASAQKADYDGRTPLHLAASKGYDDLVQFLLLEGAEANAKDNFGTTPMLEALRAGHSTTAHILQDHGASVALQAAGSDLCNAVMGGQTEYLQRLLDFGVDPNSADYDLRTPLHIAAAEGIVHVARILVASGADVLARDRWGNTALDEARLCASMPTIALLEAAILSKVSGGETVLEPAHTASAIASIHEASPLTTATLTGAAVAVAQHARRSRGGEEAAAAADLGEPASKGTARIAEEEESEERGEVDGAAPGEGQVSAPQEAGEGISVLPLSLPPLQKKAHERSASGASTPGGYWGQQAYAGGAYSGGATPMRGSGQSSPRWRAPPARGSRGPLHFSADAARKRVTLYPHHPWSRQRKVGRLVWVPPTVKDLLLLGEKHFGGHYAHVLNHDGGNIATIDLILDGDRLYLVDDAELLDQGVTEGGEGGGGGGGEGGGGADKVE